MQSLLNVGGGRATPVKLLGLHSPQTRSRSPAGVVHVPGAHANEQPILIAAPRVPFGAGLPMTEAERKFMSEFSQHATATVSTIARQVAD